MRFAAPSFRFAFVYATICFSTFWVADNRVESLSYSGWLNTSEPVSFLGKFCFRATKGLDDYDDYGQVYYLVEYPNAYDRLKLLMFYENLENWNTEITPATTCSDFIALASERGNVFSIGPNAVPINNETNRQYLNIPFSTSFNRFFFFVVVNCDPCDEEFCTEDGPLYNINYVMEAVNPSMGVIEQVSYDEILAPYFTFAAVVVSLVVVGVQIAGSVAMAKAGKFHHTVTILVIVVGLELGGYVCMTILYTQLACDTCGEVGQSSLIYKPHVFPAVILGFPAALLIMTVIGTLTKRHMFTGFLMAIGVW